MPEGARLLHAALFVTIVFTHVNALAIRPYLPDVVQSVLLPLAMPVACALLMLALCRTRHGWSGIGLCGATCTATVLFVPFCKEGITSELLLLCLIVMALGASDSETAMRTCFWALLTSLATVVVMDALGFSAATWSKPNEYWVYSYGTGHPNTLGALLFFTLAALTLAVDRTKWRLPLIGCCAATAACSLVGLSCRTAAVLELLLAAALAVEALFPRWISHLESTRMLPAIVAAGTVALAGLMVMGTVAYDADSGRFAMLDKLTNMRVSFGNRAYATLGGFTLFGRTMRFPHMIDAFTTGEEWITVDSSYVRYALSWGLVPEVCLLALLCRAAFASTQRHEPALLWTIVGLSALYGATETYPAYITYNCTLLVLAGGIRPRDQVAGTPPSEATLQPQPADRRHGPTPRRMPPPVGFCAFCVILGLLAFQAATNGTGARDISVELPRSFNLTCSPGLVPDAYFVENGHGEAGASDVRTLVQADFAADEQVTGQIFGGSVGGVVRREKTMGDALCYLVWPLEREDSFGGKWGIRLRVPGRDVPATRWEGRWALSMTDHQAGTRRGLWLTLEADGTALYGYGDLDTAAAEDADLGSPVREGTWEVHERDGVSYATCSFDDEWLTVAIEGRPT